VTLPYLQFLVLGTLLEGVRTGREVRARLRDHSVKKSGPAFYQLMGRLEDAGFVRGAYDQEIVDGQIIKQRRYEVTARGTKAWEASRDFYLRSIRDFDERRGLAGA
jgi:DNA-binding PadR family transcriptional regulator